MRVRSGITIATEEPTRQLQKHGRDVARRGMPDGLVCLGVPPVKTALQTAAWLTGAVSAVFPKPVTTLNTPGGRPASEDRMFGNVMDPHRRIRFPAPV
jgi:hypothetical protein